MKHISIIVPQGAVALGCIEGSHKAFTMVNEFLKNRGKEPGFTIQLVGMSLALQKYDGLFAVQPDTTIEDVVETDLIIIPAINGDKKMVLETNQAFVPWITRQYKMGTEVASLCVGTFLLAATGLLEGKNCTTHWQSANDFKQMFPGAILLDDKVITDEQGIYTSGGANSFWNLLIYLIGKYVDREMAILAAKYLGIEIGRSSQSEFILFKGQRGHDDDAVKDAQKFIEENYEDKITVDQLASMLAVGRRNLERRFKKATSNTIVEYMQRVKIEAAKKSLETSRKNISEIMCEVGYADTKAFRNIFKKNTGLSPIEYKTKYNREMVA